MRTVREIRESLGMSQAKFGERFSIPVRTLQAWEHGANKTPAYVLCMLNEIMDRDEIVNDVICKLENVRV